jgi:CshA-type fibril repeat protein
VLEDQSLSITVDKLLENDVEHDGESITFTGLGEAVHGTVQRQPDGTILFTPEPDYVGTAAGFSYSVEDDSGNSSTGWVSVEVLDVREVPLVIAGTRAPILEDEILTFTPEEIAGFIYDADGDVLHLDFITNIVGGEIVTANGYYSFVPDHNFSGHASFDYRANDNHRGVVDGHLEFDILSVNDPVETGEDVFDTEEDQPVTVHVDELLANDSDVDGSVFTFVALGRSVHGSAVLNPDNTVVFTPVPDYAGVEAGFEYLVQDSEGLQSIGWVQVRVNNVNDPPEIIGQSLSLLEDQPLTFDAATLTKFVRDADNDEPRITGVEAVAGGTVAEVDSVYTERLLAEAAAEMAEQQDRAGDAQARRPGAGEHDALLQFRVDDDPPTTVGWLAHVPSPESAGAARSGCSHASSPGSSASTGEGT